MLYYVSRFHFITFDPPANQVFHLGDASCLEGASNLARPWFFGGKYILPHQGIAKQCCLLAAIHEVEGSPAFARRGLFHRPINRVSSCLIDDRKSIS
jgi:hypothetical protein